MFSVVFKIFVCLTVFCMVFLNVNFAQLKKAIGIISKDSGTVTFFPDLLKSVDGQNPRGIWIYLPPGYQQSSERYPVLYMHDGQNLFDAKTAFSGEWGVDEAMDSLIKSGISASIVVGINNSADRMREYNPYDHEKFGESMADRYLAFIINELKPYVDRTYRTKTNAANTIIAGSSMGGLISYYAAMKFPEVFAKAGFFSSSFWISPALFDLKPNTVLSTQNKYFFYMGELEGDEHLKNSANYAEQLALMGEPYILNYTIANGEHQEKYWSKSFPVFYKWMMGNASNVMVPAD